MSIPGSGASYVNPLLQGWSWTGKAGTGTTVDYTFKATSEQAVDPVLREAVNSILNGISEYANIHFNYNLVSSINNQLQQSRTINGQQNHQSVDLIFSVDTTLAPGILGLTTFPFFGAGPPTESKILAADVAVNATPAELQKGGEGYVTLTHEIGHSLGLSHPNTGESQTGVKLPVAEQTSDATVMNSSFPDFGPDDFTANIRPQGMQIDDIAALQHIYGANRNFHAGNDLYDINGTEVKSRTIWDAGGVDTISTANYSGDSVIDLREGYKNVTQVGPSSASRTNIWLAYGSNIEHAQAGNGNDQVFGNSMSNILNGAGGNDVIRGALGNDTINGNQGNDNLFGGAGDDTIAGGKDNDTIDGFTGIDNLVGNMGDDVITGGDGADSIQGNEGNDILSGDNGNDILRGGFGDDQIFGGANEDIIFGGPGNDYMNGGAGFDIYVFEAGFGNDTIGGFDGAGAGGGVLDVIKISSAVVANVAAILALAVVTDSGVVINFGGGNSITLIGATNVVADDFAIF
ncbi:MAG: hypothetical protein EB060_03620 [Proteobacteria bacterium]|nr:hypothetical protein [Pseudomonadota bacterium]